MEHGSGWGPAADPGGNLTAPGAVLLRPNDKATERAALQRLKALGPLALFSEDKSRAAVAPRLAGNGWGEWPTKTLHLRERAAVAVFVQLLPLNWIRPGVTAMQGAMSVWVLLRLACGFAPMPCMDTRQMTLAH